MLFNIFPKTFCTVLFFCYSDNANFLMMGLIKIFLFFFFELKPTHKSRRAITEARCLLPLDLCQFGDGVRAVALGEDCRQLLADHLVLTKTGGKNKGVRVELRCRRVQTPAAFNHRLADSSGITKSRPREADKCVTKHTNSSVGVVKVTTPSCSGDSAALRALWRRSPAPGREVHVAAWLLES